MGLGEGYLEYVEVAKSVFYGWSVTIKVWPPGLAIVGLCYVALAFKCWWDELKNPSLDEDDEE